MKDVAHKSANDRDRVAFLRITATSRLEVIHNNLTAALEATNITSSSRGGGSRTLNAQAKSAARSAFESTKQRFYNHLLTAMKTPTLIKCIERDLKAGHAAVVQLVSTGEALMERRLADIPTEEWGDLLVDATPRDAILIVPLAFLPDTALRGVHRQRRQPGLAPGVPRRRTRAMPCGRGAPRPPDRASRVARSCSGCARSDRAALRQRPGCRGHGAVAAHRRQDRQRRRQAPRRREPGGIGQSCRDAGVPGRREAHPGLQRRRRHRPQLSRRPRRPEPAPARALPAGGRLEGRHRHPGPGPHQPHQPGAAAAVPADRHRR